MPSNSVQARDAQAEMPRTECRQADPMLSGSDDTLILVSSSLPLCLSCLLATLVALASRRIFSKGFLVYLIDLVLVY